jgi:hypothetical protein
MNSNNSQKIVTIALTKGRILEEVPAAVAKRLALLLWKTSTTAAS